MNILIREELLEGPPPLVVQTPTRGQVTLRWLSGNSLDEMQRTRAAMPDNREFLRRVLGGHMMEPKPTYQELAAWPGGDLAVLAREWSAWPSGLNRSLPEGDVESLFAQAFDDFSAESDRSLQKAMSAFGQTTRIAEDVMGSSQGAAMNYLEVPGNRLNPARWYHDRIEQHLSEQQQELHEGHSLDVRLILANGSAVFPTWFGYHGPDMLIVDGMSEQGRTVRVLLPYTTAQLVIAVVDSAETERRPAIGFQRPLPE